MTASTVSVSSAVLLERCKSALNWIQNLREQARHRYVQEVYTELKTDWWRRWRKVPTPTYDQVLVQETEKAGRDPHHAFHGHAMRHSEQERMIGLMMTACDLAACEAKDEVVLALSDLKYLGNPESIKRVRSEP